MNEENEMERMLFSLFYFLSFVFSSWFREFGEM